MRIIATCKKCGKTFTSNYYPTLINLCKRHLREAHRHMISNKTNYFIIQFVEEEITNV